MSDLHWYCILQCSSVSVVVWGCEKKRKNADVHCGTWLCMVMVMVMYGYVKSSRQSYRTGRKMGKSLRCLPASSWGSTLLCQSAPPEERQTWDFQHRQHHHQSSQWWHHYHHHRHHHHHYHNHHHHHRHYHNHRHHHNHNHHHHHFWGARTCWTRKQLCLSEKCLRWLILWWWCWWWWWRGGGWWWRWWFLLKVLLGGCQRAE